MNMPSSLTGYRIFIASPGGLQEIRQAFRDIIEKYNTEDAMRRGVVFIPVGWEHTLGGIGRPQAIINRELDECDALVLVLHDRWGTNAGAPEGHSGTEEEYERALRLHGDPESAMEELLVFFKALETERLSDPGPQLELVLDFKKKLEQERTLLFHQFETERDFEDRLRTFLASWIRDHERGQHKRQKRADQTVGQEGSEKEAIPGGQVADQLAAGNDAAQPEGTPLARAASLASAGRLTEAEAIYAELSAPNNDATALLEYGDFLWKLKRKAQAELIYRRALTTAEADGDGAVAGRANLHLGHLLSKKDELDDAEGRLNRAITELEAAGQPKHLAEAKLRLGELQAAKGEPEAAKALFESGLQDLDPTDDLEVRADLSAALAQMSADQGALEAAAELYDRARRLKVESSSTRDLADILVGLGSTSEGLGRLQEAAETYEKSLPLFDSDGDLAGLADAFDHLGHVYGSMGDTDRALQSFDRAAGLFESIQKFDSAADAYTSLAKLYAQAGHKDEAASAYRQALALVSRVKNREEVGEIYNNLEALLEPKLETPAE
jgi:tetratricopeptide (TPR) repeat protein